MASSRLIQEGFPDVEFFQKKEFDCKCCGENKMDTMFIMNLVRARRIAGIPFKINSGYRCKKHNLEEKGSPTSSHLKGLAADIACLKPSTRGSILKALITVGFKRIGIKDTCIHVDSDPDKTEAVWLYKQDGSTL